MNSPLSPKATDLFLLRRTSTPNRPIRAGGWSRALVLGLGLAVAANGAGAGPIHDAIRARDLVRVVGVLESSPDSVNERDGDRDTPLHLAVRRGDRSIVEVLLIAGAKVNVLNKGGISARRLAEGLGRDEIAWLLRERGGLSYQKGAAAGFDGSGGAPAMLDSGESIADRVKALAGGSEPILVPNPVRFGGPVFRAVLPSFSGAINYGQNEIRIQNPSPQPAEVGIRCGILGRNLTVGSGQTATARVPAGYYDLYFALGPELFQGDPVRLSGEGPRREVQTITLTRKAGGNYALHAIRP